MVWAARPESADSGRNISPLGLGSKFALCSLMQTRPRWFPVLLTAVCACAVSITDTTATDGEDDVGIVGTKADGAGFTECELGAVVTFLNNPNTTFATLKTAKVSTQAANSLIAARAAQDATPGAFASAIEVDDVKYVGAVTFRALVAASRSVCDEIEPSTTSAQTIFSPQPADQSHLARTVREVDGAQSTIDIAMYNFSESTILEALKRAVARGVTVRMVFDQANSERTNPAGTRSGALEDAGIEVRWVNKVMHHKFALIDGPRGSLEAAATAMLVTGSANWSNSAGTRYDENTSFIKGSAELALRFQREFNLLWTNSRAVVRNENIVSPSHIAITDQDIAAVDDAGLDVAFTSPNFRVTQSATNGPTFSTVAGTNSVSSALVRFIQSAERSIYVSSGHFRSRPVFEALVAKKQQNPTIDIRVYLDQQEYISESTNNRQHDELEVCIAAAGTSTTAQARCMDKGFIFSLEADKADLDLRYKFYAYRWDHSYAVQNHDKYIIVDESRVASGSYNLSDNAEHNTFENMVFYEGAEFPTLVASFVANFKAIWETGRADDLLGKLLQSQINDGDSQVPIVFPSMALTQAQVTDLKQHIRSACPDVDSAEYRTKPGEHRVCFRD